MFVSVSDLHLLLGLLLCHENMLNEWATEGVYCHHNHFRASKSDCILWSYCINEIWKYCTCWMFLPKHGYGSNHNSFTSQVNIHFLLSSTERESVCLYLTLCFLSDQQLHPERDTGAGHSAGSKPRPAPSLHHAGHWCHEETGMYRSYMCTVETVFLCI